jgi:hypothetical protein
MTINDGTFWLYLVIPYCLMRQWGVVVMFAMLAQNGIAQADAYAIHAVAFWIMILIYIYERVQTWTSAR